MDAIKAQRQSFKPFKLMNAQEKQQRISYLWKQARRYFWQQVIITRMSRAYQIEKEPVIINEDELLDVNQDEDAETTKWYLISNKGMLIQIWEQIMNAFTIYTLFTTPFVYVSLF